jgi:hypothetical protein
MRGSILIIVSASIALWSLPARAKADELYLQDENGCKVYDASPRPDETVTWSGRCIDGYADGVGVVQWLLSGKPGSRFEGTLVRGKSEGQGTIVFPSGERFEGNLHEGERSGKGVWTGPNGERYDGEWVHNKPANPKLITHKTYSTKETATGSYIPRPVTTGIDVPVDKNYVQLTPEEKRRVRSLYQSMPEGDEPPYPLHGLRPIFEAAERVQKALQVNGKLALAVTVNSKGEPINVEMIQSPDKQMTKIMAEVLLLQKYSPASCKGIPCQMQYPLRINFGTRYSSEP